MNVVALLVRLSMIVLLALRFAPAAAETLARPAPIAWGDQVWQLAIDPASGALVHIENKADPQHMNWLRAPGHWEGRDWRPDTAPGAVTLDGQWGIVTTSQTGPLFVARVNRVAERTWEAVYTSATLSVTVRRELDANGNLIESYAFKNTGVVDMDLPLGAVSISAPLFDQYPDAQESLARRAHVHVWAGGASAWVNAMRMGARPPHLGLVLTQGSLAAYSQHGGTFNDRGVFELHPGPMRLKRNETRTIAWRLFWHAGWDDFFARAAQAPGFVRLRARDYVVSAGEPLELSAESSGSLASATLAANGVPAAARIEGGRLLAAIPTSAPGDLLVTLDQDGRRSWLRAFVTPPVDTLIEARVKFIVRKQQRHAPGDPLDGAYLAYDNDTGEQVYDPRRSDLNAGRERVGMGVLGALYLPLCRDPAFKAELAQSLQRYSNYITRELEDENGVVYGEPGRRNSGRIYNFPWVAQFHLAMYHATGERDQLDRFVRVMRAYYATDKSRDFYPIGIPALDGIRTLDQAGRKFERGELLARLRAQADRYLANGANYPRSEVNYEQSIVAPAVQLLAEMYLITGERRYLEGAELQMPLLEAFAGKQPDARLNEISIRHWDDYWFGKIRVYGDTLPHYWSAINALAYAYFGLGTGDAAWLRRADAVVKGTLPLFAPDGAASAAHLYAHTSNGIAGERNDPLANDQDWALVYLLMVRGLHAAAPPQR